MRTNPHASHDRALVEAAGETSPWFADRRAEWLNYIEKKGALSERMRESATREVNLTKALEVAMSRKYVQEGENACLLVVKLLYLGYESKP